MSDFENQGGFEKREGTGALFKNNKMTSERSPVMTGYVMYKGEEIRIAGWSKVTRNGDKWLSLSAEPAGQYQGENNGDSVNHNSDSGQQGHGNQGDTGATTSTSSGGNIDDEIPF